MYQTYDTSFFVTIQAEPFSDVFSNARALRPCYLASCLRCVQFIESTLMERLLGLNLYYANLRL